MKTNQIRLQDSAVVRSAIGKVFYSQEKYEEAYDFYQQALEIREKYYEHFHVDIAISLDNISEILIDQRKYDQALEYQKRAMSICKEYYQSNHTYIALLLYRTGYILVNNNENLRSSGHLDVAYALAHIANIRYGQGMHEEFLQLYQQVLALLIQFYSSDHLDIAQASINIGNILLNGIENSEQALDFYQKIWRG
ncbi:unnamed protein product [Adineta steineri]|nr:unnamed protein product [Adineta steineri]